MPTQDGEPQHENDPSLPREPRISLLAMFILGVFFGAPILFFGYSTTAEKSATLATILILILTFLVVNISIVVLFRSKIWKLLGASWVSVLESIERSSQAYIAGERGDAVEEGFRAVKKLVARMSWYWFISSCFVVCFALVASFGTMLDSTLMSKQNAIIEWQNQFLKKQEDTRKKVEKTQQERELRRRLDTILSSSIYGHLAASGSASFIELIDETLADDFSFEDPLLPSTGRPQAVVRQSETRLFHLMMLRNQIAMERAKEIIEQLEVSNQDMVSVADYTAVSNGLLSNGQLSEAEKYARKGLKEKNGLVTDVFLHFHIAKIEYAKRDTKLAREEMATAFRMIENMPHSSVEKSGFKAVLLGFQAHLEFDLNEKEIAEKKILEAENEIAMLPNIDRGVRWRAEKLVAAFKERKLVLNRQSAPRKSLSEEDLIFQYFKEQNYWARSVPNMDEAKRHIKAYMAAEKMLKDLEEEGRQESPDLRKKTLRFPSNERLPVIDFVPIPPEEETSEKSDE